MAFRLVAIALAVLSCTASAAKVNINNNLDVPIEYHDPSTDKVGEIAAGKSFSIPMHMGNGRVDLFRKNPFNANSMAIHYIRGQRVLRYSTSHVGPGNSPFFKESRTIGPSVEPHDGKCAPIICKADSDKCEMKVKACSKEGNKYEYTDIDLDVEIGDNYSSRDE